MLKRRPFKRLQIEHAPPSPAKPLEREVVYADCSAMAQPVRKEPPNRHAHLLKMAKGKPCLIRSPLCNFNPETTVACHGAGVANGKGLSYKVSDAMTAWGCSGCNHYTDAYGGATRQQKAEVFALALIAQGEQFRAILESVHASPRDRAAARWWLDSQPQQAPEVA